MLNGKRFYCLFLAGSKKVIEYQQELNNINLFPVPDGDTGTNIASTMQYIIENAKPDHSFKATADAIAAAALDGSRGNSGAIFAQFLYGISNEAGPEESIPISRLAAIINGSVSYVYDAVARPVEGTILTVIRDWAFSYYAHSRNILSEEELFRKAYDDALVSLDRTAERMKELVKSEVVDAGAKAFVLFLEGIIEFMGHGDLKKVIRKSSLEHVTENIDIFSHSSCTFRYCTEALIQGTGINKNEIRELIQDMGDSIVVIGSESKVRIHIHTDLPAKLFDRIEKFGTLLYQKVDDIQKQIETAHHRKWKIALVTDSTCDIPQELFDCYQIHMIPIDIFFGKNHYIDKITISPDEFYTKMEHSTEKLSSSQPSMKLFLNTFSYLASHYDSIIAIHLSEKFSGTWFRSKKAAAQVSESTGKKIAVINSKNVAGTLGLIVLHAAEKIMQGCDFDEIVSSVDSLIEKSRMLINVNTLDSLIRGGRMNPVKGIIGKMVNIKPIIEIDHSGQLGMTDYAFSLNSSVQKVLQKIKSFMQHGRIVRYVILHAHDQEKVKWYTDMMVKTIGKPPEYVSEVSPVVGLNAGLGAMAVGLILE